MLYVIDRAAEIRGTVVRVDRGRGIAGSVIPVAVGVVTGPRGEQGGVGSGTGFMQELIYDPGGVAANVFDAGNLTGNIDGGTFF